MQYVAAASLVFSFKDRSPVTCVPRGVRVAARDAVSTNVDVTRYDEASLLSFSFPYF